MRLYIAEKPSLGRAIADVLPTPHQRGEGFVRVGNGDIVSWCIGHLLEQAEPEAYDPAFKQWQFEHLPIVPEQWQLQPKTKTRAQLSVLRKLVKEADELVHAGDPDREGQLLVDQVLEHLGVKGQKRERTLRCLINDLNPDAVKRALNQLRPNSEFAALSTSALARSRADWLYGINLTRAYTIQGRKAGYDGLLSVGRVQTPVLGMVVRRDIEIEQFVSKPFYEVLAHMQTVLAEPECFAAKWVPSEACLPYMDEEGRVLSQALAENVIARIGGQPGLVTKVEKTPKSQNPPLPYSLSSLQIDAAKRFGLNAKQVLDICQTLYERHKLITYPRSDSRYLPKGHWQEAGQVLAAIASNSRELSDSVASADRTIKSRAWNDSKVEAHHALIPTARKCPAETLNSLERKVYELIARQYVSQFYPKWDYTDTRVELAIGTGLFVAKVRQNRHLGWKVLFQFVSQDGQSDVMSCADGRQVDGDHSETNDYFESQLPALKVGQALTCVHGELLAKNTQPPKPFTDATLLAAMTGISRYVQDPEIRQILKDTDGLGTEATRAGILDLLFQRQFLQRVGKNIRATETGKGLINSLPAVATTPDMTARWESSLNAISQKLTRYHDFMQPLINAIGELIAQSEVKPVRWSSSAKPRGASEKTKKFAKPKKYRRKPSTV